MNGFEQLEKINSVETIVNLLIKEWKDEGLNKLDRVYLWGTGELGRFAFNEFKRNNRQIIGIVDNDVEMVGKRIENVPIIGPADLDSNITIVICSIAYGDIKRQIKSLSGNACIYYEIIPFIFKEFSPYYEVFQNLLDELVENKNKYLKIAEYCEDGLSEYIISNIIKYRLTLNGDWLEDAYKKSINKNNKIYFDEDFMSFDKEEVFVDCGGYIGDTTSEFIDFNKGDYKKIYLIEPDKELLEIAKKNLSNFSEITFFNLGIGDSKKQLRFNRHGGNGSGSVEADGECVINIERLDDIITEKPTYIKMDIEGSELIALRGGKNLISQYKPKLAISVYHKRKDLYEIVDWVNNLNLGYKFYFRHYSNSHDDTVLYCIP